MVEHSVTVGALAKALAAAQRDARHADKSAKNPHFKSSYADLAEIVAVAREAFAPHGIAWSQWLCEAEGDRFIRVTTCIMHESGEWMRATMAMPASKSDAQAFGSAATYARRYALAAALGIASDDDDGNAAVRATATRKPAGDGAGLMARIDAATTQAELDAVAGDLRAANIDPASVAAAREAWSKKRDALKGGAK